MCIFCKIINGEIPSAKVYEDEDVLAILDISQATKGHTLVMPKKHYKNLLEIEDYEYLKVMDVVKDVAHATVKAFDAEGCNVLNNCNAVAGQSVDHFHVHVIPRYTKEDITIEFKENKYDLNEVKESIVNNMPTEE